MSLKSPVMRWIWRSNASIIMVLRRRQRNLRKRLYANALPSCHVHWIWFACVNRIVTFNVRLVALLRWDCRRILSVVTRTIQLDDDDNKTKAAAHLRGSCRHVTNSPLPDRRLIVRNSLFTAISLLQTNVKSSVAIITAVRGRTTCA